MHLIQYWQQQIQKSEKMYALTFIGQIVRGETFHRERERFLRQLADEIELVIFSPTYSMGMADVVRTILIQIAYVTFFPVKKLGLSSYFSRMEKTRKVLELAHLPQFPYDRKLKRLMAPAVFGSDMLQRLAESSVVLNIHADSSPLFASNMRLFETTGIGSLLLTDYRQNLSDLFVPEKEVMIYNGVEECIEKARWCLSHPKECSAIAFEGQKLYLEGSYIRHPCSSIV